MTLYLTITGADVNKIYLGSDFPKIYEVPPEVLPPSEGIGLFLLSPFQRYDAEHYLTIAARGYGFDPSLVSFPPFFSILTGFLGRILFGQYLLASLLISNVCYFLSLYLLYLLTARRWGEWAAQNTCKWLALFPTALFLLMPYTESLFLVLVFATFYFCEDERWWLGSFFGFLAGLTRLQGIVLILPVLVMYFKRFSLTERDRDKPGNKGDELPVSEEGQKGKVVEDKSNMAFFQRFKTFSIQYAGLIIQNWRWRWSLVPILMIPAGFVGYQAYVYLFPPFPASNIVSNLSSYFYVRVVTPFETLFWAVVRPFQAIFRGEAFLNIWNFSDILALLMIVWALWVGRKLLPLEYQVFAWATLLVLLTRTGENLSLVSMMRYLITIFPAFMVVGVGLSQNRFPRLKHYNRLIVTLAVLFQGLLIGFFTVWVWAG